MDKVTNETPSPEPSDLDKAQMTTSSSIKDDGKTSLKSTTGSSQDEGQVNKALGHQGANNTGGTKVNLRVLRCTRLKLSTNYKTLYNIFKEFGQIERIKLILEHGGSSFEAFITFGDSESASKAQEGYAGSGAEESQWKTSLWNIKNVTENQSDYIPSYYMTNENTKVHRPKPTPYWYIASYKEGQENYIVGTRCLKSSFGFLTKENMKKYEKGILIKAKDPKDAALLSNFSPDEDDAISEINSHPTFNMVKGVVYSRDLFSFSEEEILEMCPPSVYKVKKLSGNNGAILLHFNTQYVPEHIIVEHSRIRVKKYKYKPRQCYNCFKFGHVAATCRNEPRCPSCSGDHKKTESCGPVRCLNCDGSHPPTSKECMRFKFEQEVLEVAHNEFISMSNAKRIVMGANQSSDSSYASVLRNIRNNSFGSRSRSKVSPSPSNGSTSVPVYVHVSRSQKNVSTRPSSSKENVSENNPNIVSQESSSSRNSNRNTQNKPNKSDNNAPKKSTTTTGKEEATKVSHPGPSKQKKQRSSSLVSLMDFDDQSSSKTQRKDRDIDDFNVPSKRHRSNKYQKDPVSEINTSNSFSALSLPEGENVQLVKVDFSVKPKDRTNENVSDTRENKKDLGKKDIGKEKNEIGTKVKLQKNPTVSSISSSSKDGRLVNIWR